MLLRLQAGCRTLLETEIAYVLFQAASGTRAMICTLSNVTSPGDEVIVLVGGTFAARWGEIATAYGLNVHVMNAHWRRGAVVEKVEESLQQWPKAEVIFHPWSESSTGVLNDMSEIGRRI